MENEPFEDVFPIENGDFPLLCLITGVYHLTFSELDFSFGGGKEGGGVTSIFFLLARHHGVYMCLPKPGATVYPLDAMARGGLIGRYNPAPHISVLHTAPTQKNSYPPISIFSMGWSAGYKDSHCPFHRVKVRRW